MKSDLVKSIDARLNDKTNLIHHVHIKKLPDPLRIEADWDPIGSVAQLEDSESGTAINCNIYTCPVCGTVMSYSTEIRHENVDKKSPVKIAEFKCPCCKTEFRTDPFVFNRGSINGFIAYPYLSSLNMYGRFLNDDEYIVQSRKYSVQKGDRFVFTFLAVATIFLSFIAILCFITAIVNLDVNAVFPLFVSSIIIAVLVWTIKALDLLSIEHSWKIMKRRW